MSKPIQYQQGYTEFYKLKFLVTSDVLIPRPETELLVDEVLSFLASPDQVWRGYPPSILDIGTGSGNIAVSIAKNLPTPGVGTRVIATDISEKALNIARQNAKLHGVENKIEFIQSYLFTTFCHSGGRRPIESHKKDAIASLQHDAPDIIVTNLPYIPSARISYLDSSVKDFEPHIALDGGKDGFELYRKLLQQIANFSLPPQGWKPKLIIGEIDYTQGELAISEAQKYFPEAKIEVKTDLARKQRILKIKFDI